MADSKVSEAQMGSFSACFAWGVSMHMHLKLAIELGLEDLT